MELLWQQIVCKYRKSFNIQITLILFFGNINEFQTKICNRIRLYDNTPIDFGCTKAENIAGIKLTGGV